jgi:hypothetical protein
MMPRRLGLSAGRLLHLSKGLTLPPAVAEAEENSSHQQQQDVGEEKKSTFRKKIESRKKHLAIWHIEKELALSKNFHSLLVSSFIYI